MLQGGKLACHLVPRGIEKAEWWFVSPSLLDGVRIFVPSCQIGVNSSQGILKLSPLKCMKQLGGRIIAPATIAIGVAMIPKFIAYNTLLSGFERGLTESITALQPDIECRLLFAEVPIFRQGQS